MAVPQSKAQSVLARNAKYLHLSPTMKIAGAAKVQLPRNSKVIPKKKEKVHPAMKQATDSFMKYHGKRAK